jgi:hypothetical protein
MTIFLHLWRLFLIIDTPPMKRAAHVGGRGGLFNSWYPTPWWKVYLLPMTVPHVHLLPAPLCSAFSIIIWSLHP